MKKFTIKNRRKRKYTRKTVETSSFPLARTVSAGILPLFILAIALVTTLIMSQAKGQTLAIHYSLTLPQPHIHDVRAALQNVPDLLSSPIAFITSMVTVITDFSKVIGTTIAYWTIQIAQALNPQPLFVAVGNSFAFLFRISVQVANSIGISVVLACIAMLQAFIIVGNAIANGMAVATHAIGVGILFVGNTLLHGILFIAQILLWLIKAFISLVTTMSIFIAIKFMAFCTTVANTVEIPFKLLWKFWLLIKPYFDILGAHINMSGADLQNGFASLGKLSTIVPPPSK